MKLQTLCIIISLSLCFFLKYQLERDRVGTRHVPKNLKPLDASYEANSLKRYSFGFDSVLSSLLWVQVLQKSDHTPLKSDEVSWEFAQVDALTTLDPRFDQAYAYGAIFLSVLRRDKLGGKIILEKWANRYPTYWRPVHMLGMHYFEELGDYASAAPLILRASNMRGSPKWLNSLGLRLLSESGSLLNAISTAIEMSRITRDPEALNNLTLRIRALNYNIQKSEFEARMNGIKANQERNLASLSIGDQKDIPESIKVLLQERFDFRWNAKDRRAVSVDSTLENILGRTGAYIDPSAVRRVK